MFFVNKTKTVYAMLIICHIHFLNLGKQIAKTPTLKIYIHCVQITKKKNVNNYVPAQVPV